MILLNMSSTGKQIIARTILDFWDRFFILIFKIADNDVSAWYRSLRKTQNIFSIFFSADHTLIRNICNKLISDFNTGDCCSFPIYNCESALLFFLTMTMIVPNLKVTTRNFQLVMKQIFLYDSSLGPIPRKIRRNNLQHAGSPENPSAQTSA